MHFNVKPHFYDAIWLNANFKNYLALSVGPHVLSLKEVKAF